MHKNCRHCREDFEITDEDLRFYDHISPIFDGKKYAIPPPALCPMCRLQTRLAFRNQTALFQRPGYPDGAMLYSMHPPTVPFPTMLNDDWMGDSWDPLAYAQEFDPATSFFVQFGQLHARSPKYARLAVRNENCDFCNNASDNKNCYMCFSLSNAEDCLYGEDVWGSSDCIDCSVTLQSERCYDCADCIRCYSLESSAFCDSCSNSFYLSLCRSCKNCFGCVNLRHKEYCIWNEQKTKEEYEAFIRGFKRGSWKERERYRQQFALFERRHPRPHVMLHQTEDCTGNYLSQSRNVRESFFIQDGENLKYCMNLYEGSNDCMDYCHSGRKAELIYQSLTCVISIARLSFCVQCRNGCSDLLYCYCCESCRNCFGCSGLKKKEYCIFNKQYTKEEYERLVSKIIGHMQKTGEWGEFFPLNLCPMPYNRSLAQRYFPLSKEEALQQGYTWLEEDVKEFAGAVDSTTLPDGLPVTNNALIVRSALSQKPFRITSQEIERYREFPVPLPRLTYEERMDERARRLGGIQLYARTCAKTGKKILTTYPPDSPFIIWEREEYEKTFQ